MSPIKGVSEVRRMPRLGKVRLGFKVEPEGKNPYPRATDYFVVADEIKEYVGNTPKKLNIMFPTEKADEFAQQWLRCYSFTQGLVCKGDGSTAIRKIDVETGDVARHTTQEWVFKQWGCDPDTCEQYLEKQCRRVMNLLFLMPDVPGFGVWQLDTTSFYSIVNINSCVDLIRRICGRISFIPLTLSLEPLEVTPPGITKKTIHILAIRSDVKLADIQKLGSSGMSGPWGLAPYTSSLWGTVRPNSAQKYLVSSFPPYALVSVTSLAFYQFVTPSDSFIPSSQYEFQ